MMRNVRSDKNGWSADRQWKRNYRHKKINIRNAQKSESAIESLISVVALVAERYKQRVLRLARKRATVRISDRLDALGFA